ncbi:MAG: DivIVA domain-containing protein [Candidatus Cellulosilyticum pullistercoris]|uniref:DivIVA domain-containing protein n=1 Tax=Candidatus Cellulosilyticum pullistercoris TaxID=2838521 RepID=A0A9E2KCZ4_9FIRM|nr:DivIVA domain-containing protein [Candidatus Cellulosilyticum pullistercoris]
MLSIVDIQNKEFKKNKIGGYNIEEVNDYLEQIIKSYQEMLNENYALKDKVNVLNESVQYYRTMESTIQNVLVLADKTAQDIKAAAYEKAEQIKKEADERAEKITLLAEERVARVIDQGRQEAYHLGQRVEEAKRQYLTYKTQFKQLVQTQMDFLEQGDERMTAIQEELSHAFLKIQEEATIKEEEEQAQVADEVASTEEEVFYTKAYMPLVKDEVE